MNSPLLRFFASLRLTTACLVAAIVLVFAGTIAQTHLGLWEAQKNYFHSFFVFWAPEGANFRIPIWPGGYLLGWLLVINLILAHIKRFKVTRKNAGLLLVHFGVLLLLVGQFFTEVFQVESAMRLEEGETKSYSESTRHTELAIVESSGSDENVVAISDNVLQKKDEIRHPVLPFRVRIKEWFPNSEPRLPSVQSDKPIEQLQLSFNSTAITRKMDEANMPSAQIAIVDSDGRESTLYVSTYLATLGTREAIRNWASPSLGTSLAKQIACEPGVRWNGREFTFSLRPTRYYKTTGAGTKPYTLTLLTFEHDRYEGTAIAKKFSSRIRLNNPNTREEREALISMNEPFRYGGETYYQGGFDPRNENVTILQVVRNPVWLTPYISCVLVGLGLLYHFIGRLLRSTQNTRQPSSVAKTEALSLGRESFSGKWLCYASIFVSVLWAAAQLLPVRDSGFRFSEFGKIPVLLNGRVQPMDSVARNALLAISGRSIVRLDPADGTLNPVQWVLEAMTNPTLADTRKIFRLENRELRALLNSHHGRLGFVSFAEIEPQLEQLQKEATVSNGKEPQLRSGYERDVMHLYESLILYRRIKNILQPEGTDEFETVLTRFSEMLPEVQKAAWHGATEDHHNDTLDKAAKLFRDFQTMAQFSYVAPVPATDDSSRQWSNCGEALLKSFRAGKIPMPVIYLAQIASAYRNGDNASFNKSVSIHRNFLAEHGYLEVGKKAAREAYFNNVQFFYRSITLYVVAMILACVTWFNGSAPIRRTASYILAIGFVLHTAGLIFRMVLQGRPPVTNLYSSAVFIGWGAVLVGFILERLQRRSFGIFSGALIGFVTLIIAHHLSLSGDTMRVMEAVLDTNVWLATHVVIIALGYTAMFFAGTLSTIAVIRHALGRTISTDELKRAAGTIFGVLCFAILFSFVGTVLGGIWADQSWGRFWGWDPKENGALMIVLWCAVVLHARLAGVLREWGMIISGFVGNIVTSFSWFGVNLMGVGLHAYGFMEGAFKWLIGFITLQVILMAVALAVRFSRERTQNAPIGAV